MTDCVEITQQDEQQQAYEAYFDAKCNDIENGINEKIALGLKKGMNLLFSRFEDMLNDKMRAMVQYEVDFRINEIRDALLLERSMEQKQSKFMAQKYTKALSKAQA